jgi:hypothetical protein
MLCAFALSIHSLTGACTFPGVPSGEHMRDAVYSCAGSDGLSPSSLFRHPRLVK